LSSELGGPWEKKQEQRKSTQQNDARRPDVDEATGTGAQGSQMSLEWLDTGCEADKVSERGAVRL
jgi:hypothetical protein